MKILRRARHLLRHPEQLPALLAQGLTKAYAKRLLLIKVFSDFLVLFRLVKAWVAGEYKQTPKAAILWAVVAILYFISPLDAIPDIFPGGYLDDIAFITFIVNRIRPNLDSFLAWEKTRKSS